jgi:hypothetical protein
MMIFLLFRANFVSSKIGQGAFYCILLGGKTKNNLNENDKRAPTTTGAQK